MNLRPDLRQPLLIAWAAFAGALVVCALALWWLSDAGDSPQQLKAAHEERTKLAGAVDLVKRITEQTAANETLRQTIDLLKTDTRFEPQVPFVVPSGNPQPGQYFNEQLAAVQDFCRPIAQSRSIEYQERLGFENTAKVPSDEAAPYLLAMLQLTRKAAFIVLSTPSPVVRFKISQPLKKSAITGPAGRPPLLREYTLKIEVRGNLKDLLWILHRLAQKEGAADYPMVVRRVTIDSKNLNPDQGIQQLDATFEIAAMQFLRDDERLALTKGTAAPKAVTAPKPTSPRVSGDDL